MPTWKSKSEKNAGIVTQLKQEVEEVIWDESIYLAISYLYLW